MIIKGGRKQRPAVRLSLAGIPQPGFVIAKNDQVSGLTEEFIVLGVSLNDKGTGDCDAEIHCKALPPCWLDREMDSLAQKG